MCFIVFGSGNIKLNFYMNIKIIIFSNYSWFYHSISFHAFLPYEMGKSLQPDFYSVIYDIIVSTPSPVPFVAFSRLVGSQDCNTRTLEHKVIDLLLLVHNLVVY